MPWTTTNTAKGDNKLYSDAKGVVPSLDLRFASQKNLNDYMTATPLVDHQRSMSGSNLSPGTFVNSSGLIETAKVNLVSYSQEFENSYYTKANITTMQATTDVAAPDGTFTARYISGASNGRFTISSSNFTSQSGRRKSIYLRAVSGSPVVNALTQAATDPNPVTLSSTEWLRFEIDTPSSEVGGTTFVLDFRGSSTTTEVYAWGLQIEEGSAATTYIPTTNLPSAAPRFDHNPTTGESLGLLVEESRTNRILLSIPPATSSTGWSVVNATGTANAISAPDGTLSGTEYSITNSDPSTKRIFSWPIQNQPIINRTVSVFAKAGTANELYMTGINAAGTIVINLNTGVVTTNTSGNTVTTEEYLNGWWRIVLTQNSGNALLYTALPSGQSGTFYLWGGQVEEGSFPTSYIPTTGTALTRSADVASITGTNFSDFYNQKEGTVFADITPVDVETIALLAYFNTTSFFESHGIIKTNATLSGPGLYINADNYSGGSGTINLDSNNTGQRFKAAYSYKDSDFKASYEGGAVLTGVWRSPSPTNFWLGQRDAGVFASRTHIFRFTYFPERLPDATLQAITAS